jgi:hypothetical protein
MEIRQGHRSVSVPFASGPHIPDMGSSVAPPARPRARDPPSAWSQSTPEIRVQPLKGEEAMLAHRLFSLPDSRS